MQGKTKSGFAYKCDDRVLTDWRFTMAVSKTQSGDGFEKLEGAQKMIQMLLGEDGYEKLMEHIASKNDGYVPAENVMSEVADILNAYKEAKN